MSICDSLSQTLGLAIARSLEFNEIVTLAYSDSLHRELFDICDGTASSGAFREIEEFWGTDEGGEWRVHLRRKGLTDEAT